MFRWLGCLFTLGFYLLFTIPKAKKMAKHKDKYSFEERYAFGCKIYKMMYKYFNIRLHVEGLEYFDKDNAQLLISNHQSYFDPMMVPVFPSPIRLIAKKEIQKYFVAGDIGELLDSLWLDRDDLRASVKVISNAIEYLNNNENIWVYPEGTRSKHKDHHMNEFHHGTFKIALKSQRPILPIAIDKSYNVLSFKEGKIDVYMCILKPIHYEEYKDMDTAKIAEKVQGLIQEKLDELKNLGAK